MPIFEISTRDGATIIDGEYFQIIMVAYRDFEDESQEIDNFIVRICDEDDEISVTFVPKIDEQEGPTLGGRTRHGREIHYYISKSDGRIIRKHYAR